MEDYYTHRNSSHRYLITKIDDSDKIQLIDGEGLTDEKHTKIMRVYPHGFSSHSIEDAHMVVIGLGGRRDMIVAIGGEHADKRPKNLPKGDTILYNAEGDVIRIFGKKTIDITHSKNIKLSIGKGLKDSQGGQGGSGGAQGEGQSQGKEAEAGEDKDVTFVMTENDITATKGDVSIKWEKDKLTLTKGDTTTVMEGNKITHKADHVVIESNKVDLGAEGGMPVGLCGGGCSSKVFAAP
jgi:phage gp45-like